MDKRQKILSGFIIGLFFVSLLLTYSVGELNGETTGYTNGYANGVNDLANLAGVDYKLTRLDNGSYLLRTVGQSGLVRNSIITMDLTVNYYLDGVLIEQSRHAGVLTTIGANYIAAHISSLSTISPNNSANATHISVSADTANGMSAASTILTNEINSNGFTRHIGTYTLTGTGTWTIAYTFTSSGTQTVQLWGCNWIVTSQADNTLLCYDTSAAIPTITGATVSATWSFSVT